MRPRIRTTLIALPLVLLAVAALYYGIKLRQYAFESTMDQRFTRNIMNAWMWGRNAQATGVFKVYDNVMKGDMLPAYFPLDYPPLRLSLATAWQAWARIHYPESPRKWHEEYAFNAPMLWTDTTAAILAAIVAFLLVRMWVIRMDDARRAPTPSMETRRDEGNEGNEETENGIAKLNYFVPLRAPSSLRVSDVPPKPFRGVWQGMLAALLIWFNPAALWNGYVWVQWDMWPVPFYLAAVLLACVDWWFAAGVCLAIGSCLKGQMLIAVPIMFIWPLWQARFGAILRLLAGMGLMFTMIIFPWLNPTKSALSWFMQTLFATALLAPIALRLKLRWPWVAALGVIAALLAWPWMSSAPIDKRLYPMAVLLLVALARHLPVRSLPHVYALAVALSVPMMIPLFDAKTGWFSRGFQAGAERSQKMHDIGTYNVPALLQNLNSWPNDVKFIVAEVKVSHNTTIKIPMKPGAIGLYIASLLLCGFAAARFEKQRDSRFLLAMFLPWLMLYMLLPQMFSRYLLWAGVISGILAGVDVGLTLLGVIVSLLATAGMVQNHYQMVSEAREAFPNLYRNLQAVEPHLGWALLLITLIYLYFTIAPRSKLLHRQCR